MHNLDFTFLRTYSTTRQEVTKNLAPIDTHSREAGFSWGRWESSKWGYGAFGGGVGSLAVAGGRTWGAENIFITFDPKGVVSTWTIVDDRKLFHQLDLLKGADISPREAMSDVREVELPASRQVDAIHTASLILSQESLECGEIWIFRSNIQKITNHSRERRASKCR
jgi:hypothetical protein